MSNRNFKKDFLLGLQTKEIFFVKVIQKTGVLSNMELQKLIKIQYSFIKKIFYQRDILKLYYRKKTIDERI